MSDKTRTTRDIRSQAAGAITQEINKKYMRELYESLYHIDTQRISDIQLVDQHLDEALKCIENVRTFVGSPENILGSQLTKHGEIAEQVDVWFQNAWNIMDGKPATATFDGVGRTAPEDYLVDGIKVQSKYINGSSKSLSHVLEHLEKYTDIGFGRDGSYYVIPKDQYKEIQSILQGDTGGLSEKTVRAIKDKVHQIETATKRPFAEAVRPGNVNYAEVQQGAIHNTLNSEDVRINQYADTKKDAIDNKAERDRAQAHEHAKPSWGKAIETAGTAAVVSGGFQFASGIYHKCKSGKKIQDFTTEDWKELGIDTAKAAGEGGISGLAIYGLTNIAHIPTPVGAAGVSLVFSIVELVFDYHNGKISKAEFIDGCQTACINAVVSAVGAVVGGKLIPVPVLGEILGSIIAGNIFDEICGRGASEAIANASYYVYGMTHSIQDNLKTIERNTMRTQRNFVRGARLQNQIEAGFNAFEKLKES